MACALLHALLLESEGTAAGDACFFFVSALASHTFRLERALSAAVFYTTHPALLSRDFINWLRVSRSVGPPRRGPLTPSAVRALGFSQAGADGALPGGEEAGDPSAALAALWGPQGNLSVEAFLESGPQDWKQLLATDVSNSSSSSTSSGSSSSSSSSGSFSATAQTARDKIQTLEEQLKVLAALLEEATASDGALEGPPEGAPGEPLEGAPGEPLEGAPKATLEGAPEQPLQEALEKSLEESLEGAPKEPLEGAAVELLEGLPEGASDGRATGDSGEGAP
ncbi:hypothetical protein Efla_002943 [Eimeria flavescens]